MKNKRRIRRTLALMLMFALTFTNVFSNIIAGSAELFSDGDIGMITMDSDKNVATADTTDDVFGSGETEADEFIGAPVENEESYTLSGRVVLTDASEEPIAIQNIRVCLVDAETDILIKEMLTDEAGEFKTENVSKGEYYIEFFDENDVFVPEDYILKEPEQDCDYSVKTAEEGKQYFAKIEEMKLTEDKFVSLELKKNDTTNEETDEFIEIEVPIEEESDEIVEIEVPDEEESDEIVEIEVPDEEESDEIVEIEVPIEEETNEIEEALMEIEDVSLFEEAEPTTLTYEDENIVITVSELDAGAIPIGAVLKVVPITKEDEEIEAQYYEVEEQLQGNVQNENYSILGFLAYDITFVDENGEKIEPTGQVQVSINYKEAVVPETVDTENITETNITVMHLEEDADGSVLEIVDMEQSEQLLNLETTEANKVQSAEFATNSFSVFTIIWKSENLLQTYSEGLVTANKLPVVDTRAKGIDISLFDYDFRINLNSGTQYSRKSLKEKQFYFMAGGGDTSGSDQTYLDENQNAIDSNYYYTTGQYTLSPPWFVRQDMVCWNLKNGYPELNSNYENRDFTNFGKSQTTVPSGSTLSYLFDPDSWGVTNACIGLTGLLRQDADGYYYYDSAQNHAQVNGDCIDVYDATLIHSNKGKGQFLPFNDINEAQNGSKSNEYSIEKGDLWFGMKIDEEFYQPKDGQVNGKDMVFEFSGDDDVWVFVDGVKLLDIGGIHAVAYGKINFKTGEIEVQSENTGDDNYVSSTTTILECFKKAYAEKTSPASSEDDFLSQYFEKDESGNFESTFKNFSEHTLNFFYFERGASESNCSLKFNTPMLGQESVTIEKEIENYDEGTFNDVEFSFKMYTGNNDNKDTFSVLANQTYILKDANGTEIEKTTDESGVFKLKHNEKAIFSGLTEGTKYYVEEVGVDSEKYGKVTINSTVKELTDNANATVSSEIFTVGEDDAVVHFKNQCTVDNLKHLVIRKIFDEAFETEDTYTMKVTLGGALYKGSYKVGNSYEEAINSQTVVHTSDGMITIKAGETAVILGNTVEDGIRGIPSRTSFKVEELADGLSESSYQAPDFKIKDADSVNTVSGFAGTGYASGKLLFGKNAEVTVTNKMYHSIEVEKKWEGNTPAAGTEIYVGLYKVATVDGSETLTPAADAALKILNSENGYQAVFDKLTTGTYTVRELKEISDDTAQEEFSYEGKRFAAVSEGDHITIHNIQYKVQYSELSSDEQKKNEHFITITNQSLVKLNIKKVGSDENVTLSGAKFELKDSEGKAWSITTDENGMGSLENLEPGTYTLQEIEAPEGYALSEQIYTITLPYEETEDSTVEGAEDSKIISGEKTVYYEITKIVTNYPIYSLPSTGSTGIFVYLIGGVLLMTAAAWILYKRKCREVLRG